MNLRILLRWVVAGWLVFVAGPLRAADVTVFAAASLSDALDEIAPLYHAATGNTLRCNFGASGTLARQIQEGAPADIFFSADEARMDLLEHAGLIVPGTRRIVLVNQLVLVVPAEGGPSVAAMADLLKPGIWRIAIGEPATVPAGTYAKQYLMKVGLWDRIGDKLVPLDNVRAVLAAVGSGSADAGFVYRTDAMISRNVKIALAVPAADATKITYPAVLLRNAGHLEAARAFLDFLGQPAAQKVFARFGFLAPK